jgi:hypothetical protein
MQKIKNIIIFTVIALVFFFIYIFFIKPSPEQADLVSSGAGDILPNMDGSIVDTNTSNTNSFIAKDFLVLFSNIKNIKLNDSIFSNPAFSSLHDSSITLMPDGTEGRPNPFAQFGKDVTPTPIINNSNSSPVPSIIPAPVKSKI